MSSAFCLGVPHSQRDRYRSAMAAERVSPFFGVYQFGGIAQESYMQMVKGLAGLTEIQIHVEHDAMKVESSSGSCPRPSTTCSWHAGVGQGGGAGQRTVMEQSVYREPQGGDWSQVTAWGDVGTEPEQIARECCHEDVWECMGCCAVGSQMFPAST